MRYAIIGLGPVGSRIAAAAARVGHAVSWYDPDGRIPSSTERARSIAEASKGADRIVSAVPSSAASEVFAAAGTDVRPPALYEDWSSAIPDEKRRFGVSGGDGYVDVTLLDTITSSEPLLCLAGKNAAIVAPELRGLGFEVMVVGSEPGAAAMVKMVRSSFMKPFEVLSIELLRTTARWDPSGAAIASIERTLATGFADLSAMLLETNRRHAARRAEELIEVMGSVGLESGRAMLQASCDYLSALGRIWARVDAPPLEAARDELLAFLSNPATEKTDDG
jgi:3-hydroxyisobutyrate dehydrogenase